VSLGGVNRRLATRRRTSGIWAWIGRFNRSTVGDNLCLRWSASDQKSCRSDIFSVHQIADDDLSTSVAKQLPFDVDVSQCVSSLAPVAARASIASV